MLVEELASFHEVVVESVPTPMVPRAFMFALQAIELETALTMPVRPVFDVFTILVITVIFPW